MRILRKEPDLIEHMSDRITSLLKDRAHGVILTTLQLIIEIIDLLPDTLVEYVKLVPSLVRLLRYTYKCYTYYTCVQTYALNLYLLFMRYAYTYIR